MTLAEMPYTSTGPAITNSFAPRPRISPSLLNSIAGETMAFAKPVIGTIVPAPAYFASFSYKCRQVSRAPRNTIVMAVAAAVSSVSSPRESHSCRTPSPAVQIAPPMRNASKQSRHSGEFGLLRSSSC